MVVCVCLPVCVRLLLYMYATHRSAAYLVDLHGPVHTAQVRGDLCVECDELFLLDQVQLDFGALKKNAIHRCGIRDVVPLSDKAVRLPLYSTPNAVSGTFPMTRLKEVPRNTFVAQFARNHGSEVEIRFVAILSGRPVTHEVHCCDVGVGRLDVTKYRLQVRPYSSRVVPRAVRYGTERLRSFGRVVHSCV